jgi:hypothetical protein
MMADLSAVAFTPFGAEQHGRDCKRGEGRAAIGKPPQRSVNRITTRRKDALQMKPTTSRSSVTMITAAPRASDSPASTSAANPQTNRNRASARVMRFVPGKSACDCLLAHPPGEPCDESDKQRPNRS